MAQINTARKLQHDFEYHAEPAASKWHKLCVLLRESFEVSRAMEISENICITPLSELKLGISFKSAIDLNEFCRNRLRQCIRRVYGNQVNIVTLNTGRIEQASELNDRIHKPRVKTEINRSSSVDTEVGREKEITTTGASANINEADSKWESVRRGIIASRVNGIEHWLGRVRVVSYIDGVLKLEAPSLVCIRLQNHQSLLENLASENDLEIVVKNTTYGETLYFPWIKEKHGFFNS